MSIELKHAAEKALVVLGSATSFMSRKARDQHESVVAELRTSIQQADAQQPDNTACKSVRKRLEAQQPATGEPVQADSSGHLRVIASLGAALRRLSFAAQTTGGTDGPDAELQSAIGQAEQALSLGGIWQAMSATPEPVWCVATGERVNGEETYTHHDAYVPLADCFPLYTHPAPGVPDGYVLVPIEPTKEMLQAMQSSGWLPGCYAAMLTAAQAQKG